MSVNTKENTNENKGDFLRHYICRTPKKNHYAIVQINNQVTDTFKEWEYNA